MLIKNISDELLNSFVDNQLDSSEKVQMFDAISQDETMKERVCELRSLKETVKLAYNHPPVYLRQPEKQLRSWAKQYQALAACLLLLLGGASGWLTHSWSGKLSDQNNVVIHQASQPIESVAETRKIIVHISNSNPMRLNAVLDETESLLNSYRRANRQLQIEVIANKRGVDLLRSDVSAYEERISLMQEKYPNLNFLVCGKTISKLQNNGEVVQLLPHTGIASSADEQINKRLHQGWGYVKI